MKLWLDDLRPVPYGYEGARSVNEAKQLILEAEHSTFKGPGIQRLWIWIMIWEIMRIRAANTANPVGRANMERILARYWGEQYW